jgi:oxygen-independent coproporphyrinogen-3 oxidase
MLSLYVHIPFCVRKCHYCGFYSTEYSRQQSDNYISALEREAADYQCAFADRIIDSIYIGGGTPTALTPDQLKRVLAVTRGYFPIDSKAECTIEANPNSLSRDHLSVLRQQGVNRLSLGVQSFSDDLLIFLGRPHTAQQAVDAFRLARSEGFGNVGIDLIYGIPGQTGSQWQGTLDKAVDLGPEHISAYSLSLDEGSRFMTESAGRFTLPDDESTAAQYRSAVSTLSRFGYERYEISNFALSGFACRHNGNYWERGEYLGLGPGAWSFVKNKRYQTVADVHEYSARLRTRESVVAFEESIDERQSAQERVMLGLRTSQGLDLGRYEEEFGAVAARHLKESAEPLERLDLLEEADGNLRLTEGGFLLANEVLLRLSS